MFDSAKKVELDLSFENAFLGGHYHRTRIIPHFASKFNADEMNNLTGNIFAR